MTTTGSTSNATKTSLGAGIISSLNVGSGIDTDGLVTKLTAAQKASLETAITTKQTVNAAQVSAAASLANDVAGFSSSLDTLIAGGTLMTQPVSSATAVATAAALPGSRLGTLSATLTVTALARAQTIESQPIAAGTSYAVGTFKITTVGGASATLEAGRDFTDLGSLVAAINAKAGDTGVTASAETDGSGTHLVLKGATGASRGFSVAADQDVAAFAYSPVAGDTAAPDIATGAGMQRLQSSQDAAFAIDGVSYSRPTNAVSDAIPGIKLTLASTGTTSLTAQRPTAAITQAIGDFVSTYNALRAELASATAAATSTTTAGALRGNQTVREMQRRLSQLTTTPLIAKGNVTTLAQLGVKTAQDGTLSVDGAVLARTVAAYPDDVESMFNPAQTSSSAAVTITSKVGTVAAGTYALSGLVPATGDNPARGAIDGMAATGKGSTLTADVASAAAGLSFTLGANAPSTATLAIDLGLGGALALVKTALTGTDGSMTAFQKRLKTDGDTLADQLAAAEAKLTVYHDRLVTQFSAMNTRVSGYKATQDYLTQQIDLWTKSND